MKKFLSVFFCIVLLLGATVAGDSFYGDILNAMSIKVSAYNYSVGQAVEVVAGYHWGTVGKDSTKKYHGACIVYITDTAYYYKGVNYYGINYTKPGNPRIGWIPETDMIPPVAKVTCNVSSLTLNPGSSSVITFSYSGTTDNVHLNYYSNNIAVCSAEWTGEWVDHSHALTVYGNNAGTTTLTVTLKSSSTNESLASTSITVTVPDIESPSISNVNITNVSLNGYTVSCNVYDNVGVTQVSFPTWTANNGQDDLIWHTGIISGSTAYFNVNISDHNYETGTYITHIYAYDSAGNSTNTGTSITLGVFDIYFDANGGICDTSSKSVTYNSTYGELPTPTWSGYNFIGWYTSENSGTQITASSIVSITSNQTLYAHWSDSTKPTGSITSTNNVATSQTATLKLSDNTNLAGYYWGTNSSYSKNTYTTINGTSKTVTKAISSSGTYYLTVKDTDGNISSTVSKTFYKTTLNTAGGSVTPTSVITMSGNSFKLPSATLTGYSLVGWNTKSDGSGTSYKAGASYKPTANTTLYAQWKETTKPTGSITSTNNVATSQTATLKLSDNTNLAGYYWGTNSSYSKNTYTTINGTSKTVTKAISSSGTYYLTVKDTDGNISSTVSKTFYKTTLNTAGGSVTPTSVITMSGNSFKLPNATLTGYSLVGWNTKSDGKGTSFKAGASYKPSNNATLYAQWKKDVEENIYNLGEETYSFENYGDYDSPYGHCFGMSITSSGYYTGDLDKSIIGLKGNNLYSMRQTSTVTAPICYYQDRQGPFSIEATVAGGSYYLTEVSDISSDWNQVINYVKNHNYDEKGNLQIGFRKNDEGGHAINFLRYEEVNGQQRIYAYDNNYPNTETYFYKDSSGRVYQTPGTFSGAIDCIALRDVSKYYNSVGGYDRTRFIYAEKDTIKIKGAIEYPMEIASKNVEYYMYEVPVNAEKVKIVPLVDGASFEYVNHEYDFSGIDNDTYGTLTIIPTDNYNETAVSRDDLIADFTINNAPSSISIKNFTTSRFESYKTTITFTATYENKPTGATIHWFINGIEKGSGETYTVEKATSTYTVQTKLVAKDGRVIAESEVETVNINSGFFAKLIAFFKNLFGSLPVIKQ